ncbi:phospholipase A and acyltransferase 3-like [Pecten maximus]|uniref:phospholipase A and acyltransferase 3-like n=1 Tax=Pecten maximus TaxID=6579 RepID=UPI001458F2C6|nr:phospholipase A and acyltransferase 3-like [Pecten maximus]XP_033725543.1 phospholipase A and acyltransferase 3-like [Pecten maximus]XP_033725551.1 phospholipase A and acyltransferase 3-like [Pecten maximus]XP_033725558.1 phospholipase A and acyltransferase 3-like [Pecten maximus]
MALTNVDPHNATVLRELKVGDLVEFPRLLYSHWGVYIGNQQIVHLTGVDGAGSTDALTSGSLFSVCGVNFDKACAKIDDFFKVANGCKAKRNNGKDRECSPLQPREIVRRAKEMVGEIGYNVLWNNCEHFAAFLRYDRKWSEQVDKAAAVTVVAGAAAVVTGVTIGLIAGANKNKDK